MRRLLIAAMVLVLSGMTMSAGRVAQGKVGGNAGRIAFGRWDASVEDQIIFTVRPDGTGLKQISPGAAEVPRWSPDGTELATAGLTIYRADGAGSRTLPTPPGFSPETIFGCNVWSPDGSRLACEVLDFEHPDRNGIYTLRSSDGGDLRRLSVSPDGDDIPTDYSPEGSWVLFLHQDLTRPADRSWAFHVVHPDGSGLHRVTPWLSGADGGSWSPDGRWIAYATKGRVHLIRPDGSGMRLVKIDTDGRRYGADFPVWSPDGTRLAMMLFVEGIDSRDVYTMRADGTDLQKITSALPGSFEVGEGDLFPDWGAQPS